MSTTLEREEVFWKARLLVCITACGIYGLLTLGAHAQRGLQYLVCQSFRPSVCPVERSIGGRTQSIIGRGYKELELSQVNSCDTG